MLDVSSIEENGRVEMDGTEEDRDSRALSPVEPLVDVGFLRDKCPETVSGILADKGVAMICPCELEGGTVATRVS